MHHALLMALVLAWNAWSPVEARATSARATVELLGALESRVAQRALTTREGRDLMRLVGATTVDDFGHALLRAENAALRREVLGELRKIETAVAEFRGLRGTRAGTLLRERALIRELSARHLLVLPDGVLPRGMRLRGGRMRFAAESPGLSRARSRFLEGTTAEGASPATGAAARRGAFTRVRGFYEEMRECVANQAPSQAKKNFIKYLITGIGISETVTLGSYVVGTGLNHAHLEDLPEDASALDKFRVVVESGVEHISWADISTDLIVNFFATAANTFLMKGQDLTFQARYIRYLMLSGSRNVVDAGVYYLNPIDDSAVGDENTSRTEATAYRFGYNISWMVALGWRGVLLYELTQGLMCLHPGSRAVSWGTTGLRFINSAGGGVAYFYLRNRMLGGEDPAPDPLRPHQDDDLVGIPYDTP